MKARPLVVVAALVLCSVVMGASGGPLQRPSISSLLNRFRNSLPPRPMNQSPVSGGNPYLALPKLPTVVSFSWTRTLGRVSVKEEATHPNISQVSAMTVKSRDSRLNSVGFTAATTLYVFGQRDTTVIVKTGSGLPPGPLQGPQRPKSADSTCFVLPSRSLSFAQASGQLRARDNKTISAPVTVEKFSATGKALSSQTRFQMSMQNPMLFIFCAFSELRTAVPLTAGASFPVTAAGKVLKMVTLDKELQILVPLKPDVVGI